MPYMIPYRTVSVDITRSTSCSLDPGHQKSISGPPSSHDDQDRTSLKGRYDRVAT